MKKIIISTLTIIISLATIYTAVEASYESVIAVEGAEFSVGESLSDESVDNKGSFYFLKDHSKGAESENLSLTIDGPSYKDINNSWSEDFKIKVVNKYADKLSLVSKADYVDDPDSLRDDIFINVISWDDQDGDGLVSSDELGSSYGYDSILRLRNDTFSLGDIQPDQIKGFVFKFDGSGITKSNLSKSAKFNFELVASDT